jgi:hypothetical protein
VLRIELSVVLWVAPRSVRPRSGDTHAPPAIRLLGPGWE